MKLSVLLAVLTSASASLCYIFPFLGIVGGSGSVMGAVSGLEPSRLFFIGGTFLLLGFAWYKTLKTSTGQCRCERKPSFLQSKKFLGIVTVISFVLIAFPSYSHFLIQEPQATTTAVDQERNKKITLSVSGMTCSSCELHIESGVIKLSGVSSVKASYASKSTIVEYDLRKVDEEKIVAAINETGYKVKKNVSLLQSAAKADCSTKGSCTPETCSSMPKVIAPKERSKNLKMLAKMDEFKDAFNKQDGKVRFVAILSSTRGWCLQGAQAVQETVIEQMAKKGISVIIVWTNMLKSDDKDNAFKAASMFKDPSIVQYFDEENKLGDIVARSLNPEGEKAWDIYMYFDKEDQWNNIIPRPLEYAHQLSESLHPWADQTKYFSGKDLTKRLNDITTSL